MIDIWYIMTKMRSGKPYHLRCTPVSGCRTLTARDAPRRMTRDLRSANPARTRRDQNEIRTLAVDRLWWGWRHWHPGLPECRRKWSSSGRLPRGERLWLPRGWLLASCTRIVPRLPRPRFCYGPYWARIDLHRQKQKAISVDGCISQLSAGVCNPGRCGKRGLHNVCQPWLHRLNGRPGVCATPWIRANKWLVQNIRDPCLRQTFTALPVSVRSAFVLLLIFWPSSSVTCISFRCLSKDFIHIAINYLWYQRSSQAVWS